MRLAQVLVSFAAILASVWATRVSYANGIISTPLGNVTGTATIPGVYRFVFRYADAARWRTATAVMAIESFSALPPVCPQELPDGSGWTGQEDCLFVVLYVPDSFSGSTITWFHGGSLIVGGANDPAIEGSRLALATQSIVAVIQYRLGVLGFLPARLANGAPNANLGVQDAILALNLFHAILPSFNSSSQKVILAGHSAGAFLIRAIVASPSASSLYAKVIMHSDTLNYGFYNASTLTTLQDGFFPTINCAPTNATCQNALSLDTIMNAQLDFNPADFDPSTLGPIPFRPVHDGSLITTTLTTTFPSALKPLLLTTVHDEGAPTIFGAIDFVLPSVAYPQVLSGVLPDFRADAVLNSSFYQLDADDSDTVREELKDIVTDLGWRCPDWVFAKAWASRAPAVFTGTFLLGGLHSSNAEIDFCSESDTHVCHSDDLPILFGTQENPTDTQSALITEVQARWNNFIRSSTPNPAGVLTWSATTSSNINTFALGGSGPIAAGACTGFWGTSQAPFDYQLWGL